MKLLSKYIKNLKLLPIVPVDQNFKNYITNIAVDTYYDYKITKNYTTTIFNKSIFQTIKDNIQLFDDEELVKIVEMNDNIKFQKYYNLHNKEIINYGIFTNDDIIYNNIFIPIQISDYFYNKPIKTIIYKCENITITIYNHKRINVKRVIHCCKIMEKIANSSIPINIFFLESDFKKILTSDPITIENVNSGCSIKGEFVYIWRYEEYLKVLIHELIHYFGLEFYNDDQGRYDLERYFEEKYNKYFNINEAYTEALAVVIHTIYIKYLFKLKSIERLINIEISFSHDAVIRLLKRYNVNNIDELANVIDNNTNVYAYYIIKYIIIYNIDKWMLYLKDIFIDKKERKIMDIIDKSEISIIARDIKENTMRMTGLEIID